ncbi:MAG: hypothetical protein ACRDTH_07750 [Pseudonocardiaceae bacterium]
MSFGDGYRDRTDEEMLIAFHGWDAPAMEGITWDKLKEHGYLRLNVGTPDVRAPHAEANFPGSPPADRAQICPLCDTRDER